MCSLLFYSCLLKKKIEENKVHVKLLYKLFINRLLLLLLLNKKLFSKIILILLN